MHAARISVNRHHQAEATQDPFARQLEAAQFDKGDELARAPRRLVRVCVRRRRPPTVNACVRAGPRGTGCLTVSDCQ